MSIGILNDAFQAVAPPPPPTKLVIGLSPIGYAADPARLPPLPLLFLKADILVAMPLHFKLEQKFNTSHPGDRGGTQKGKRQPASQPARRKEAVRTLIIIRVICI